MLDVECYKNYFLIMFKSLETKTIKKFRIYGNTKYSPVNTKTILKLMNDYTTIGFNSYHYDTVLITAALKGYTPAQLKELSDIIITGHSKRHHISNNYSINVPIGWDHIDIIEPAPGVAVSLKTYGGRMGSKTLQELPIDHWKEIEEHEFELMELYCENDLDTTIELYYSVEKQIKLREDFGREYNLDLRSKSDAQIAEAVFKKRLKEKGVSVFNPDIQPGYKFKYNMPNFIEFKSDILNELINIIEEIDFKTNSKGSVLLPEALNYEIKFDGAVYKLGIGGLHSQEKKQAITIEDDEMLFDADVASYYPRIILNQELYPHHLTRYFLNIYKDIVDTRLAAKHSGDNIIADSFKIVINGSSGKFGSEYSFLYSPDLLVQTTLSGQLGLLMLIETVTSAGGRVVNANTDGIVIKCKKSQYEAIQDSMNEWEFTTGFDLEETHYKALYSESVNSYIALKAEGGFKTKGLYALPGLQKNPVSAVCIKAVTAYLEHGIDMAETIFDNTSINDFITVRKVKGGGVWKDEYLGGTVRWYYSNEEADIITYKLNGNKVPNSDGCRPLMVLPNELPEDIDYEYYVNESYKMLVKLGIK